MEKDTCLQLLGENTIINKKY